MLKPGKSKAAFEHNVGTEMDAGKPQKQALAIAYAMKRRARKMADGGTVSIWDNIKSNLTSGHSAENKSWAEGGMVGNDDDDFLTDVDDQDPFDSDMPADEQEEEKLPNRVARAIAKIRNRR